MPVYERRQHFRIEDYIYFNYRILKPGELCSDSIEANQLLGKNGQRYLDASHYFQQIDYQLTKLTQALTTKDSSIASYLNLLNAKIDYLSRQILLTNTIQLHKVGISLGGMSFKTLELIKENTRLKLMICTKPKMIPILVEGIVVYSEYQSEHNYRTAVTFGKLTEDQEELLSQHILMAQIKTRCD